MRWNGPSIALSHRAFPWLLLALAALVAAPASAAAQELRFPPASNAVPDAAPHDSEARDAEAREPATRSAEISCDTCAPAVTHRYWIVSSRRSPQHIEELGTTAHLDYFHVNSLGQMQRGNCQSFAASMQPDRPVCIMIHGSFVDWETMLRDSARTDSWLKRATGETPQLVYFTWPSDKRHRLGFVANVEFLGCKADINGFYLAQLIQHIPPQAPICLLGHSHGTRVASSTLNLLGGGVSEGKRLRPGFDRGHRIRAIYFASALDHHWLRPGQRYGCTLRRAEMLVNVRNRRDVALALYGIRRPFARQAFARVGLTRRDRERLGPEAHKVIELDASEVIGAGHIWPYYYTRQEIADAITPIVLFY